MNIENSCCGKKNTIKFFVFFVHLHGDITREMMKWWENFAWLNFLFAINYMKRKHYSKNEDLKMLNVIVEISPK